MHACTCNIPYIVYRLNFVIVRVYVRKGIRETEGGRRENEERRGENSGLKMHI